MHISKFSLSPPSSPSPSSSTMATTTTTITLNGNNIHHHHQTASTATAATSVDNNDSHHQPPPLPCIDHYQTAITATTTTTTTISIDDDSGHHHLLHLPLTPTLMHTTHCPSLLAHATKMLWGTVTLALTAQGLAAMVTRAFPITSPLPLDGPPIPQVYVLLLLVQHCHSHLSL